MANDMHHRPRSKSKRSLTTLPSCAGLRYGIHFQHRGRGIKESMSKIADGTIKAVQIDSKTTVAEVVKDLVGKLGLPSKFGSGWSLWQIATPEGTFICAVRWFARIDC